MITHKVKCIICGKFFLPEKSYNQVKCEDCKKIIRGKEDGIEI